MSFHKYSQTETWFREVRNLYCVGRNFRDHASELGNQVPESPMILRQVYARNPPAYGEVPYPAPRSWSTTSSSCAYGSRICFAADPPLDAVGAVALGLDSRIAICSRN